MTISKKIKLACKYAGISEAEMARRAGTTPQNWSNRAQVDKLSTEEINRFVTAIGARYEFTIVFPDGTRI